MQLFYQKKTQIPFNIFNMAKAKELSVEDKLRALYSLQLIDSKIDEIRNVRGELPLEVVDLEAEVEGLTNRLDKLKSDLETNELQVKLKKNDIGEHAAAIKKYEEQQKNVRNNREFDSLTKEIEFQDLEIQLAEKHIKEFKASAEHKKQVITESSERLEQKKEHLKHKKAELDAIMSETEKEETALLKMSSDFEKKIEERLITAYKRIRGSVKNGLAVVSIERGASAGSFFTIPPQTQMEIASRKKILTDEHSGRILVDSLLAEEEKEKMDKVLSKL